MNATLVIPQDVVDSQLAKCADGEVSDFTVKGGTFTLVPGVGAVVSGPTVAKKGYKGAGAEPENAAEGENAGETAAEGGVEEPMPKMSPAAMSVVGRKSKGY